MADTQQILTYLVIAICVYFIYQQMCNCSKKESFTDVARIDDNHITDHVDEKLCNDRYYSTCRHSYTTQAFRDNFECTKNPNFHSVNNKQLIGVEEHKVCNCQCGKN